MPDAGIVVSVSVGVVSILAEGRNKYTQSMGNTRLSILQRLFNGCDKWSVLFSGEVGAV